MHCASGTHSYHLPRLCQQNLDSTEIPVANHSEAEVSAKERTSRPFGPFLSYPSAASCSLVVTSVGHIWKPIRQDASGFPCGRPESVHKIFSCCGSKTRLLGCRWFLSPTGVLSQGQKPAWSLEKMTDQMAGSINHTDSRRTHGIYTPDSPTGYLE